MLMESCPGKTVVSGVMGFALGGAFGLFMASVSFHTIHNNKRNGC
jgi:mitochondrial import inner membrane translocase subunit TIM22